MATGLKLKLGDVLAIDCDSCVAYLQYSGRHEEYGDAVFVSSQTFEKKQEDLSKVFLHGYFTFYPAKDSVKAKLASVVGSVEARAMPRVWRRRGAIVGKTVVSWIIEDGSSEAIRRALSSSEKTLPIASIWNHEMLLHMIRTGWHPSREA